VFKAQLAESDRFFDIFPDCKRTDEIASAIDYVQGKFLQQQSLFGRDVFVYYATVTDADNVTHIFSYCMSTLLQVTNSLPS
jgi:hypothetical protein